MGAGWMQGARFSRRSPIYLKRTTTHLRFFQPMPQGEGLALYTTIPVMQAEIPETPAEMKRAPATLHLTTS